MSAWRGRIQCSPGAPAPLRFDDHVIIWMLMAVTALLMCCSLVSLGHCAFSLSTPAPLFSFSLSLRCNFLSRSVSWLLQGLWLTILYLMHSSVLMALTIPITHCLGSPQSITTLWACTTHKVCELLFILECCVDDRAVSFRRVRGGSCAAVLAPVGTDWNVS